MDETSAVLAAPQHMLALERANRVRLARAALKRKVAAGHMDVSNVVLECPWEAESMTLSELLTSQRRWGRTRCRRFLLPLTMSENKTIGSLTERQRLLLNAALKAKSDRIAGSHRDQPEHRALVAA